MQNVGVIIRREAVYNLPRDYCTSPCVVAPTAAQTADSLYVTGSSVPSCRRGEDKQGLILLSSYSLFWSGKSSDNN